MTINIAPPEDNRELFARIRRLWSILDPVPDGLVDDILVLIATEDLGDEYALLTLVEHSDHLAGIRGLSDSRTLEFTDGAVTILLRISPAAPGQRRIDGWLSPASTATLRLALGVDERAVQASPEGRFVFADVPEGRARMWLDPVSGEATGAARRGFTTPEFDL